MLSVRLVGFIALIMPLSVLAQSGPGGVGTTDGTSSLELWLSADKNVSTNSGAVQSWGDRSGNTNDASPGTAPQLNSSALGGKPTIEFDGSNNEYLNLSSAVSVGSNVTVFIVFKPQNQIDNSKNQKTLLANDGNGSNTGFVTLGQTTTDASGETLTFGRNNGSSDEGYRYDQTINSNFLIHNFDYNGTSANYYQDNGNANTNLSSFTSGFSSSESLKSLNRIGADASPSNYFNGQIAEIIIYSRQLGTEERNLVANYLDAKYQLKELANNDYFPNSTSHNNEPIGITANSPKATEGGGLNIDDVNNNVGDHIFEAHGGSSEGSTTTYNSGKDTRWQRNWKIDITTSAGGNDRMDITFNFDEYGVTNTDPSTGNAGDYEIVESSSSSFSSTGTITPNQNKITLNSNSITFSVKLTKISSNGPYFTLGSGDPNNSPLPVEWQYFKGEARAQENVLKWGTASETQDRHFQVQRSGSDKEDFRTIATIPAAGTTIEPQDYRYTDAVSNRQTHYYRLKQVDLDDSFEYSNVIALGDGPSAPAEAELELSRNPVPQGQPIRYRFAHARQQPVTVKLYDARGQQRHSQQLSGDQGARALRADDLSPGVYWLRVAFGQKTISRKLVIY